jgi:anthranilate synthase/aminodeoxychorismate synthase-like glutamine amidotransferase
MILVIDNYDSFTYNLVRSLGELGAAVEVHRNDAIDVAGIEARAPQGILISPGPGTPERAGVTLSALRAFAGKLPVLGVCLGHQALGAVFGAKVVRAARLMHGRTSPVEHDGCGVFAGLPTPLRAMRYHSLVVERASLPASLVVSAWTAEGEIMGLRHERFALEGVQFHPESFLSEHGHGLLANFVDQCARHVLRRASEAA